tara:strand:- start:8343 stop:8918 length:576 start_codon:yes stop_codon:yes gene_type:complete
MSLSYVLLDRSKIDALLKDQGISVPRLAELAKCHPDTIYGKGPGKRTRTDISKRIADVLGVSLGEVTVEEEQCIENTAPGSQEKINQFYSQEIATCSFCGEPRYLKAKICRGPNCGAEIVEGPTNSELKTAAALGAGAGALVTIVGGHLLGAFPSIVVLTWGGGIGLLLGSVYCMLTHRDDVRYFRFFLNP